MNRRIKDAEEEYRALELYLQQAQEEIGLIGYKKATLGDGVKTDKVPTLDLLSLVNNQNKDELDISSTLENENRQNSQVDSKSDALIENHWDCLCDQKRMSTGLMHPQAVAIKIFQEDENSECGCRSSYNASSCDIIGGNPTTKDLDSEKLDTDKDEMKTPTVVDTSVIKEMSIPQKAPELQNTMLEEVQSPNMQLELPAPIEVPSIDKSEEMISRALDTHRIKKNGSDNECKTDLKGFPEKSSANNTEHCMAIQTSLEEISVHNLGCNEMSDIQLQLPDHTDTLSSSENLSNQNLLPDEQLTLKSSSSLRKPNSFPCELVHDNGMFINDHSPEMQVVFKSLSPVLLRRKPSGRGRKGEKSKENELVDAAAKKSDQLVIGDLNNKVGYGISDNRTSVDIRNGSNKIDSKMLENLLKDHGVHIANKPTIILNDSGAGKNTDNQMESNVKPQMSNGLEPKLKNNPLTVNNSHNIDAEDEGQRDGDARDQPSDLFMDPSMARTWHGTTSRQWKQFYAPVMRSVLDEMNEKNRENSQNGPHDNISMTGSIPTCSSTSQTLLDSMHRKFCAYQYVKQSKSLSQEPLMPYQFKLNHSPVIHAKNFIRVPAYIPMESHSSSSPDSAGSSPRLEHEQIHVNKKKFRMRSSSADHHNHHEKKEHKHQSTCRIDAEIEAVESCCWLREAGFPQYAQMYEDGKFPIDIDSVERDHDFLDKDSMQSLFRRLETLNKCAIMKIRTPTRKTSDESDDEDQCALSDKWKYQRSSRQWSRKELCPILSEDGHFTVRSTSSHDSLLTDQNSSSETGDSPVLDSKMHHNGHLKESYNNQKLSTPNDSGGQMTFALSPRLRRAASERLKGAKNFIKRMESLKTRRGRRGPRTIVEISGPVITDKEDMQQKIQHLNCKDLSPSDTPSSLLDELSSDNNLSPILNITPPWSDTSVEYHTANNSFNDSRQNDSSAYVTPHSKLSGISSMENSLVSNDSASSNNEKDFSWKSRNDSPHETDDSFLPSDYKPGTFPRMLPNGYIHVGQGHKVNYRTGSFSMGKENSPSVVNSKMHLKRCGSFDPRMNTHRVSVYDNVSPEEDLNAAQKELDIILFQLFEDINGLNKAIYGEEAEILVPPSFNVTSTDPDIRADPHDNQEDEEGEEPDIVSGTLLSPDHSDHEANDDFAADDLPEHFEARERRDSGVGSSLTRPQSDHRRYRIRWHSFQKSHRPSIRSRNTLIGSLSVGQFMVLRKLSLLKLTTLIEKYSPANRSGWNWSIPRFLKRHKTPDYFDKNVFGVPLYTVLQRTGQALPQCMLHAMRYLRKTAVDAVGIFRKSGVRSRIQKLRNDVEADQAQVNFEELQAYDVADLLKQYFRELPECLLTHKLSDIFISIFIHVPQDLRLEAMQSTMMLMPDENREVLQTLLLFLSDISHDSAEHHMNASNVAVCFAPSLFNIGVSNRGNQSPSPRRARKNLGVPDAKELQEQKAAHECLTVMIQECKKLFIIPPAMMKNCRFSYIEQGDPIPFDDFNKKNEDDEPGYMSYVNSCIQGLLKESREKFRGWVNAQISSEVELAYKKVVDSHPLRLWKCAVEVEAPPNEVLERVLNERHLWDEDLLKWHIVEKLDTNTEIFQYSCNSMAPHPTRDYCVLRSWRTDLPKGACVLISTSVEHPNATPMGTLRGVVLASRYLIEPCGSGRSKLTHISRVDTRGRSPEWYKKAYGHMCISMIEKIRESLKQKTEGRETSV
ncbi:hypothetical protein ScPMuIL_009990 [Solemya velum]